jgi:MFS family permease
VLCGLLSDRLSKQQPERKVTLAISYALLSALFFTVGFTLGAGIAQLACLAMGMFLVSATTGPAGAMVANLTHAAVHGTAFAALTLMNNLLGLAPGPLITGLLADSVGLGTALALAPLASVLAAVAFYHARHHYLTDLGTMQRSIDVEA